MGLLTTVQMFIVQNMMRLQESAQMEMSKWFLSVLGVYSIINDIKERCYFLLSENDR